MNMLLRVRSSEKNQKLPKFTYYCSNNIYIFAIVVFLTGNVTKYKTYNNALANFVFFLKNINKFQLYLSPLYCWLSFIYQQGFYTH